MLVGSYAEFRRTGIAMPKNVPRNSMGFEDPSAFFKSPAMTEAPSSVNTIRTGASMFSGLKSGRRGLERPADIDDTPAPRGKGRMSQLVASDEEDGSGLGDEFLNDDDGVLDPSELVIYLWPNQCGSMDRVASSWEYANTRPFQPRSVVCLQLCVFLA